MVTICNKNVPVTNCVTRRYVSIIIIIVIIIINIITINSAQPAVRSEGCTVSQLLKVSLGHCDHESMMNLVPSLFDRRDDWS